MDSRKIIKFGNSSYVVTLPFEWVRKHELDKGNSLNLSQNNDSIILSIDKGKTEKIATINVNDKPLKILNREIISYYLKNYDFITLTGNDLIDKLEEIKVIKEKLSSVEIVEINNEHILLKDLTSISELSAIKLIFEVIEMEKVIFDELIKDTNDQRHYFISSLDANINKLTFLTYKALNYNLDSLSAPEQIKDTIHYWRIITSLEFIGDKLKRIARYLKDSKKKEHVEYINGLVNDIKDYFCFVTSLLDENVNVENNLKLYLDKKQSLLIEFENIRDKFKDELTLYLVLTQLFKDLLGEIGNIVLSIIDLKNK